MSARTEAAICPQSLPRQPARTDRVRTRSDASANSIVVHQPRQREDRERADQLTERSITRAEALDDPEG